MTVFTAREDATDVVDWEQMTKLSGELTATLDQVSGWERLDDDSFVSARLVDGKATIVGNSGGWWLVRPGPGDKQVADPQPSARDALAELTGKPTKGAKS